MAFQLYILLMYIESVHDDKYPGVLVGVLTKMGSKIKGMRRAFSGERGLWSVESLSRVPKRFVMG